MPQMAPMMWLNMMLTMMFFIMLILSIMYFIKNSNIMMTSFNKKLHIKNMKKMW